MAKSAVALAIFLVIGLQLASAKRRPMQKSETEILRSKTDFDDKELYLSKIDEKDILIIIDGIKAKKDTGPGALYKENRQFAVLCYVPTGKGVSYSTLTKKGLCDWSAPNPNNNNDHSEQILLQRAFNVLKQNYYNEYGTLQYNILLYTFNSPCKTCAEMIVNTLSKVHEVFEFRVAYHQRYIWKNRKVPDPDGTKVLQESTEIFDEFNRSYVRRRMTPFISLQQYN